jgi:malonate-semialdehyde dehydrogenase (acetylating)/methylmalonate-semialdehyde dehydrogenase
LAPGAGNTAPLYDPATGQACGQVPLAGATEVAQAASIATAAQPAWAALPALQRARVLLRFRELLLANAGRIARTISGEHGKVLDDAHGELQRGVEVVEFAAGIPQLLKGEFSDSVGTGIDSHSLRQPLGVVLGVTPFNFPVMVPLWMAPVALACGNAFILKPSELDPSASLLLAQLLQEAGLPDGVFSVVQGNAATVQALLARPEVQALSFVGSTPVARSLYEQAAQLGKRAQCLGGAKNHMVVLPDADPDQVIESLVGAAFGSAGERCMAISVAVLVGAAGNAAFTGQLAARVRALRIGTPTTAGVEMGPLVSAAHRERVIGHIGRGVAEGARLLVDGRGYTLAGHEHGFFLGGSLFDAVTPTMALWREEIFGPVLCIARVPDLDAAIALVNGHAYGNGCAIYTRDGGSAREFSRRVQAGMVGVNVAIPVPMAFHSFGGWQASLFGDHAVHGAEGVRFYTRLKTVTTRWPAGGPAPGADFTMPTLR